MRGAQPQSLLPSGAKGTYICVALEEIHGRASDDKVRTLLFDGIKHVNAMLCSASITKPQRAIRPLQSAKVAQAPHEAAVVIAGDNVNHPLGHLKMLHFSGNQRDTSPGHQFAHNGGQLTPVCPSRQRRTVQAGTAKVNRHEMLVDSHHVTHLPIDLKQAVLIHAGQQPAEVLAVWSKAMGHRAIDLVERMRRTV